MYCAIMRSKRIDSEIDAFVIRCSISTLKNRFSDRLNKHLFSFMLIIETIFLFPLFSFQFTESSFFISLLIDMLSVNIPRDRTSGTITRMVPHASDTDRDRRRSIVSRCASKKTRQRKVERRAIYYVARGIGAFIVSTDTAFLQSLFARPEEDEHGELLKLPRSEMTVQGPSVLP